MLNWVEAMVEKNDTITENPMTVYNEIIAYYQGLGIDNFDETTMEQIVGKGSLLWMIIIRQ
jgi:hypothetical protein